MLIALKIDVTKLEKARFFQGKNGAIYADVLLNIKDDFSEDQYGQCGFLVQSVTKDEKQSGVKLPICGNAKMLARPKPAAPAPRSNPHSTAPRNDFAEDDSVPF